MAQNWFQFKQFEYVDAEQVFLSALCRGGRRPSDREAPASCRLLAEGLRCDVRGGACNTFINVSLERHSSLWALA